MNTEIADKLYRTALALRKWCCHTVALALTLGIAATVKAQGNLHIVAGDDTVYEYGLDNSTIDVPLFSAARAVAAIRISGNNLIVSDGTVGQHALSGKTVDASPIPGAINPLAIATFGNGLFSAKVAGSIGQPETSDDSPGPINRTAAATSGNDFFSLDLPGAIGQSTASGTPANFFVANADGTVGVYMTSGGPIASVNSSGTANTLPVSSLENPSSTAALGNAVSVTGAGGATGEFTLSANPPSAPLGSLLPTDVSIANLKKLPEPSCVPFASLGAAMMWLWLRRFRGTLNTGMRRRVSREVLAHGHHARAAKAGHEEDEHGK